MIDEILVERLAGLLWRLRRVGLFEGEVFVWIGERQAKAFDQPPRQPLLAWQGEGPGCTPHGARIGWSLEELFDKDLAFKLGRYEAHLARQMQQVIHDLRSFKRDCS